MSSLLDDQPALATIARRFLALPAGRREEFALRVARQDPAHLELLERAVAEELAVGWRATPATMAHHLTGGERKLWRYVRLLGERYVQAYDGIRPHQQWWIASQYGKGVELHTPIPTPSGWRRMGDLAAGDVVYGGDGQPCRVTLAAAPRLLDCYEVALHDGARLVADGDHLWPVTDAGGARRVVDTRALSAEPAGVTLSACPGLVPGATVGLRSVTPVPAVPTRCVQVDSPDSTYLAGDHLTVTHNTTTLMDAVNWTLDRDPTKRIMYVSYDANKAVEEGGKARDFAREHSGDLRFQLRDDQAARGRWATEQGGGLYCVGIMGGIIGWPVDVLLLDDLLKGWEWAHSDAIRQKVFNVYRSQCRFRMQSHTDPIIVAGTRMHYDDVQARLLALSRSDPAADQWDVLRLPTVAEECDPASPDELLHEPDPLGREPGELLEPDRFPAQEVAARRATAGSYLWNVMEQQRGVPEEGNEILRSWWRVDENLPPQFDEIVVSWDCKLKDKESGDFVVGGTWGRVGSAYWLYAILRGQWNQPTTENAIALAAVREPRARLHVVENTGNGPEVMTALREPKPDYEVSDAVAGLLGMTAAERVAVQELRRRGVPGIVPENVPAQNKAVRMRAHSGLVEAGNVHLWARMAGLAAFLDELSAFPRGAHDDQVDMTSQALKRLRHGTATVHSAASTPMPPTQVQRQPGAGVVGRASRLDIGRVR